ncbi:MAG: helicase [Planctomycetota bacterium]|nr:MAG: helicase [Planctomycetota bacterium]
MVTKVVARGSQSGRKPNKSKPSGVLTLKDRLSRLTYAQAVQMLGNQGTRLLQQGGKWNVEDWDDQVYLRGDLFRLKLAPKTVVTITAMADAKARLHWRCTACETLCEHVGAAFALILDEKLSLGLAAAPAERVQMELLTEEQLFAEALRQREERAKAERMRIRPVDASDKAPWGDYLLTSAASGKTYRVALRGSEPGTSYCSCPDFRTNTLGTCKHILHLLGKLKRKFPAPAFDRPYTRRETAVFLKYGEEVELSVAAPEKVEPQVAKVIGPLRASGVKDVQDLVRRIAQLEHAGHDVTIYPDAEEYIQQQLHRERIQHLVAEIRKNPAEHPLRRELLKVELLPYQLDGIAFAAAAGRAILADDMGLGKTIQGVGLAELLAREAGIRRVLVVCPASLKSQWRNEITRFSDRSCQLITGSTASRSGQYQNDAMFTVCNYEQVLRDIQFVEQTPWDLIVLDEGQRIKNWEAKTSRVIKGLKSRFALVLSGTPMENRLDELYSVVQFVDDRRLGPGFRFFHRHRMVDEKGKVLGYKNLAELRERLAPILLRRTRDSVLQQLPPRTVEIVRITPTDEQLELHRTHMQIVSTIVRKKFISEMDLLRLQKALLMCRMSADSTVLVNKERPGFSSKLEQLDEMIDRLFAEPARKAVLFSEWTTMLDLIEPLLKKRKLGYVRLDGSVPQAKRQQLVHEFQNHESCRLFLTTNAGSTGLNLQAADTVINVDLPWNPAVLEQRIARAHRMGQKRPVQVFVLVTEGTIEEGLLTTLAQKKELAQAAIDFDSEIDQVDLQSGMSELKNRLEVLLGAVAEAPVDVSQQRERELEAERLQRREKVAAAGGQLLSAAFQLLGELLPGVETPQTQAVAASLKERLADCVETNGEGQSQLTITLPDGNALDQLATSLARLLSLRPAEGG